jgi:iron complex outermembrane recepter protein
MSALGRRDLAASISQHCACVARLIVPVACVFVIADVAVASERSSVERIPEEVIVTAQKRGEESITEVPVSVSVLGGRDLEASGARGVADALNQVGGVNLLEVEPGRSNISIRGAAAGAPTLTGSSPVGFYIDELPFAWISNAIVPDVNAFDLQRVEVLRGPQGTLYGSSSLNGVVRILSNDANLSEFEVHGRTRTGWTESGDNSYSGDLAVNVPLVEGRLGIRGVASYADIGGYVDNPARKNFNDSEVQNYRVKVNAAPTDRLSIALGAYFSRIENDGSSAADENYRNPFTDRQGGTRDYDAYNLLVTYELPSFTVLSSSGYIDLSGQGAFDIDLGIPVTLEDNLSAELFSQEVRIHSSFDGPWQVSGGVFYRSIDQLLNQAVPQFFVFPLEFSDEAESYAFFGELTRTLMEGKLELTGGLRYFEETVKTRELSSLFTGTAGPLVSGVESTSDAITWRAIANYHPGDNQTLYLSVATGFRAGFNQAATSLAVEPTLPAAKPDDLITYELGMKGVVSEGRVIYDIAIYNTTWNDTQQLRTTSLQTAAIINAGSSSGYGIDGSVAGRVTDSFSLNANAGWNNLEFDSDTFQSGAILLPRGGRMMESPELTVGIGAEYRFPIGESGLSGFVAADVRYTSESVRYNVAAAQRIESTYDDRYDSDLRMGVEADQWTFSTFVENVANESATVGPSAGVGLPLGVRQRPRTIGVQATFNY